ncbi:MAG: alpha/beta hydrolase [Clostridiales bacterium]|nr:alpha/beta hydrolase [Clostridiales bacterium]
MKRNPHKASLAEGIAEKKTTQKKGTIRDSKFIEGWMNMETRIPEPVYDWIKRKHIDVPYGENELQKLDIYLPNDEKYAKPPLFAVVHGGGFSHMDKRDWHIYPGFFALREGFAVASVNYRLAPKYGYPHGLDDFKSALKFLAEHAEAYGYDKDNVFLEGTSAGGNFVTLGALMPEDYGLNIRAVAALCPGVSMIDMYENFRNSGGLLFRFLVRRMTKQYLGTLPPKDIERAREAGYEKWLADAEESGRKIPPFYILQGDADPLIPEKITRKFYERIKTLLAPEDLVYRVLPEAGHAGGGPDFFDEENIMGFLNFFKRYVV